MQFLLRAGISAVILGNLPDLTALTWETTSRSLVIEAGTGDQAVEFPFKNEGAGVVTILELKSSCGCSTPTVKSRTVPAGESGSVRVAYAAGDRTGLQSARLTVKTDEVGAAPTSLSLQVQIQPSITLVPRLVHWSKTQEATPRTITIKQVGKSPVRIVEIKAAGDALTTELKPAPEAGTWELTLTPKSISQISTTKVEIVTEISGRKTTYTVFGVVR